MADKYLQHPDLLELVRCAVEQEEEAKFKVRFRVSLDS